ncbi:hypothetical protein F5Y19DRAFT_446044 [Xylariaceae sp. FL1651]|nr:hypothetical protein F5Y19DRAFT_446044 [Xylariaceae sp. FL1651]
MKLLTASVATLLIYTSTVISTPTRQFEKFLGGWDGLIQGYLRNNCSDQYAAYLTGNVNYTVGAESLVNPVLDCVLGVFPESRKAELGTSALILGLIPTILQTIGSTTAETALVGYRRPLLGFLLSAGSPTVAMMKSREFAQSIAEFVEGGNPRDLEIPGLGWSRVPAKMGILVSIAEYILVGGAVANVVYLAWQLGVHAIAIFAPNTVFGVPLWTLGAAIIHLAGVLALWLRVRMRNVDAKDGDEFARRTETLNTWVPTQFLPAAFHPSMRLEWRQESLLFYFLTWAISIGILLQVVFGTLVLSGLLFFSLADSLGIVGRYILSAIICRGIVRLELSGMVASMAPNKGRGSKESVETEQIVLTSWKQPQEM